MPEFDASHGYSQADLLKVPIPTPPADFANFWQNTYAEAMQAPLNITRRRIVSPNPLYNLWEVEWDSWEGLRVGGWISVPVDGQFERGVVVGHGYGGRSEPQITIDGSPAAIISPCARGFHRSAHPGIPDNGHEHVLHGIESRENYVHRGCVVDYWTAASVLLELYPETSQQLDYYGGSFGGGLGALMLPWDARFGRAFLDVPSFGNYPLRVHLACMGSGQSVSELFLTQPEIMEVLAYYDAASAAQFIRIPTYVAAALSDPAVPPAGQFAVYNALPGEKELFVRQTGHPDVPEDSKKLSRLLNAWFS